MKKIINNMQEGEDKNFNKNTIVNDNNYVKYIHYLESNLIVLLVLKIELCHAKKVFCI